MEEVALVRHTHAVLPSGGIAIKTDRTRPGSRGPACWWRGRWASPRLPTPFATYAFAASGVITDRDRLIADRIAAPAVLVPRSIGVTVSPRRFTTYAVTGRAILGVAVARRPRDRAGLRTGWVELFLGWTSSVSCSSWSPTDSGAG